jgi:cell pole-organizing protein PopZ
MRLAGEPSVDEILDSIKKVIARDDRAGIAARQKISRDGIPAHPEYEEDDVLDLAVSASFLASEDEPELPETDNHPDAAPLVTAGSRAAMRESLAALAMMAEPAASPQIVRSGETSLEEMARELLRPALAQWLDQHLPAMVEKLVAKEIARIVGKKS